MSLKGIHMSLRGMSSYELKRDPYDLKGVRLYEITVLEG